MRGVQTLRIELGSVTKTMEPLTAASYLLGMRNPQQLDGLEHLLLEHLAATENALAHVRRMKIAEAPGFPIAR